MTVLIMEPVALKRTKIQTGHNLATDFAQTLMTHWTAIYVISDAVSVLMIAQELPEPYVSWKATKLSLSGELHPMTFQIQVHFEFDFHLALPFCQ